MLSEFEIIRRFFTHPTDPASGVVLGVGDDAALVKPTAGMELAISTDMLVADRHFFADTDPYKLGHKSLAVNLSDMAAMGAKPRWITLALALPEPLVEIHRRPRRLIWIVSFAFRIFFSFRIRFLGFFFLLCPVAAHRLQLFFNRGQLFFFRL